MDDAKVHLHGMAAEAMADFEHVSFLAQRPVLASDAVIEIAVSPHSPPTALPTGKMAVYAFFYRGLALKVGKVGPNSGPRYTSQHYNPNSARSNLARSLLANGTAIEHIDADETTIGLWIKQQTDRINLLLPADAGLAVLSLLEAFLHVRWRPLFEGRAAEQ